MGVVFAAPLMVLAACSDSAPATAAIVEDTALVGTWKGRTTSSFGDGEGTLKLRSDSTLTAENENPNYGIYPLTGVWTVNAARFTATANDGHGFSVTLVAPAPFVRLAGTWNANNGQTGTFDFAKR